MVVYVMDNKYSRFFRCLELALLHICLKFMHLQPCRSCEVAYCMLSYILIKLFVTDFWLTSSTDPIIFNNPKIVFISFERNWVKSECSQWYIPQTYKISISNILYFEIHKNNKSVDLSMYIFTSPNLSDFVI